ncbi:uncharacterized protein LOC105434226 [Pogonomyrmex barbatus]|uniref:Uncharacterized protein LOC105434226 n=1 Tax=Pogonomyrmex barbatus TaxID=144034 RepID=A0A6I9WXC5_9HYME|nr:uncharacterized protein LOC105434226 [Pogonomyrmex barbatus]
MYQGKRRERAAVEKLTKRFGAAEIRIDGTKVAKSAGFGQNIEMVQKDTQVPACEIKKSAAIAPEKSTQKNLRKSEKYKRNDKASHTDDRSISRAAGLETRGRYEERKRERWFHKRKLRKRREPDDSSSQRRSCDKATLIKEKLYNKKGKRENICSRDVHTQRHASTQVEDFMSRAKRRPGDIRREKKIISTTVPGLIENRQTQCNLRDREDIQNGKDNVRDLKSTNETEVSCHVKPQFKTSEQMFRRQDYNYPDQRKLLHSCNEYVYTQILQIL